MKNTVYVVGLHSKQWDCIRWCLKNIPDDMWETIRNDETDKWMMENVVTDGPEIPQHLVNCTGLKWRQRKYCPVELPILFFGVFKFTNPNDAMMFKLRCA
jgi:hypothetical protein